MRSIEEQIASMAHRWPEFRLTDGGSRSAVWEGELSPDKRTHLVRIKYEVPLLIGNWTVHAVQPRVQVIKPLLEGHPDYEQGPIPHVYVSKQTPELPYLCLFSPSMMEWTPEDLLSGTTVFWAAEWLYFYEGWLLTKRWRGGGRHPGPANGTKRIETV